ncbi:hypothetical protein BDY24DRAFT_373871 [Mrakia frigida]|uniref:uncharacterized protein n=1 Tax=Mrakia frigida TaxID=29902 RepID=UPI003FCBF59B
MAPTTTLSQSESSYIVSSLSLPTPIRTDGRSLLDYRSFSLSTGVAPQANGSARVLLGGVGGTEIVTAIRLEVLDRSVGLGKEEGSSVGGRPDVVCSVECSSTAFPYLDPKAVDKLSDHLTTLLQHTIPPLLPPLPITPSLSFHYTIDSLILSSSAGNLTDTLFLSVRSALHDLKVPRTRNVAYEAVLKSEEGENDMAGIKGAAMGAKKDLRGGEKVARGAEFEVEDYWDEGDLLALDVRENLPVCVTLNLLSNSTHFLDASLAESLACPTHLLLFVTGKGNLAGMRFIGQETTSIQQMKELIEAGKSYAANMIAGTNLKLKDPSTATAGGMMGGLGFFGS